MRMKDMTPTLTAVWGLAGKNEGLKERDYPVLSGKAKLEITNCDT